MNKTRNIYIITFVLLLAVAELLKSLDIWGLANSRILDWATNAVCVIFGIMMAKTYEKKPN